MDVNDLVLGEMYTTEFVTPAQYLNKSQLIHEVYDIQPGEVFMVLSVKEYKEINATDVEILYNNRKMWLTIHLRECMIGDVRRAESYDIPFVALQEVEPGSNLLFFSDKPHIPHIV